MGPAPGSAGGAAACPPARRSSVPACQGAPLLTGGCSPLLSSCTRTALRLRGARSRVRRQRAPARSR
ncbi:MAG TPA: hypothetical protein DIT61_11285, partial [Pseudomonas sp.]|nr:hypothetical protein [Pseudomonas sp.]